MTFFSYTGLIPPKEASRISIDRQEYCYHVLEYKGGSHVIFYDNVSGISAARGVWLLLYFSHKKVGMLDGGFEKWKKEGYPIEVKTNPLKYAEFKGRINYKVLATAKEIKGSLNNKNVSIVDARSSKEFDGSDVRAVRRGHVPSAINIDWENNIENGVFKSNSKLSRIYLVVPKKSQIITYCQGGYRAANTFLVLKLLGYDKVKMYLGSWGEWGNRPRSSSLYWRLNLKFLFKHISIRLLNFNT